VNDFERVYMPRCLQQLRSGKWLPLNELHQPLGSRLSEVDRHRAPRSLDDFDFLAFHIPDTTPLGVPDSDKRIWLTASSLPLLLTVGMTLDELPPEKREEQRRRFSDRSYPWRSGRY